MVLINHTNHPSTRWEANQKEGFSEIFDLPFPNVSPEATEDDIKQLAMLNYQKIINIKEEFSFKRTVLCLQGEFSYCYYLYSLLRGSGIDIVIPTTERIVTEKDGVKTSVFNFVKWRTVST